MTYILLSPTGKPAAKRLAEATRRGAATRAGRPWNAVTARNRIRLTVPAGTVPIHLQMHHAAAP